CGIEVAHRVTSSFVVAQDVGDQLCSGAVGAFAFSGLIGAIHPEAQSLVHVEFHCCLVMRTIDRPSHMPKISIARRFKMDDPRPERLQSPEAGLPKSLSHGPGPSM